MLSVYSDSKSESTTSGSVLILGADQTLGRYVFHYFKNFTGFLVSESITEHLDGSGNDFRQVSDWIRQTPVPHYIINTIDIVASSDTQSLFQINAVFPRSLALFLKSCHPDVLFIHISTDAVFSGLTNSPYTESSIPDPADVYSSSKFLGEDSSYLCIRTSTLGEEFIPDQTSLIGKLHSTKMFFGFVNHKWNGVTCLELAKILEKIIKSDKQRGIIHISSKETITKFDLCQLIKKTYNLPVAINYARTDKSCNRVLHGSIKYDTPSLESQLEELKVYSKGMRSELLGSYQLSR